MKVSKIMLFASVSVFACSGRDQSYSGPSGPLSRILVDSAGAIILNGRVVDSAMLGDSLRAVAAAHGGIVYSRANPDRDPSPAQAPASHQVMALIVANKLPVRLTRPESLQTVGK
jgi:hypothetical protein